MEQKREVTVIWPKETDGPSKGCCFILYPDGHQEKKCPCPFERPDDPNVDK